MDVIDKLPKGNEAIAAKKRKIRKIKIGTSRHRSEAATFAEATGAKSAGAAGWTRMDGHVQTCFQRSAFFTYMGWTPHSAGNGFQLIIVP